MKLVIEAGDFDIDLLTCRFKTCSIKRGWGNQYEKIP